MKEQSLDGIDPVEPPESAKCRLRQNRGDFLLNRVTPEVKCEIYVKEENISDVDEMDEALSIPLEFVNADTSSVKMEREDKERFQEEEVLIMESARILLAERLANGTEKQRLRSIERLVDRTEDFNLPKRGRPRKRFRHSPTEKETAEQKGIQPKGMVVRDEVSKTTKQGRGRPRKRRGQHRVLSVEETSLRVERAKIKAAERLANETAEQRTRRLERVRWNHHKASKKRKQERRERKATLRLERLAAETEQERLERLERSRLHTLKFRESLTEEARQEMLERRRTERLNRLANETEEETAMRLARQKIAGLKWRAKQPEEQRIAIIERAKERRSKRLATESEEERLKRLERKRKAERLRRSKLREHHKKSKDNSKGASSSGKSTVETDPLEMLQEM